jgi:2-dehydro-3-deoxygluconokinase
MRPDVVAVGEVLVDISVPQLVPGGVVHAPVALSPGGAPVNAALAAWALGARAAVVGRVGADVGGSAIRAALVEAGVEALLAVDEDVATGIFVEVGAGPERAIVTDRGASAKLAVKDLSASLAAGAVFVSGYALLHDDTAAAAAAALARADAEWVAVSMGSAALVERCGAEEVHARASGATVFFANEAEAVALTGHGPEDAVRELGFRYEIACVTLGPRGAIAVREGRIERATPAAQDAAEITGSGDAFAAAFLVSLLRGSDLGAALSAACDSARRLAIATRSGPGAWRSQQPPPGPTHRASRTGAGRGSSPS